MTAKGRRPATGCGAAAAIVAVAAIACAMSCTSSPGAPDAVRPVDAGSAGDARTAPDAGADAGAADAGPVADGGSAADGGDGRSAYYGSVVFNEILTDGTAEGDPNGDGDADPVEDQFVELVSVSASSVPMGGFRLVERDLASVPRHTFEAGFVLAPGRAVVVFGGGDAPAASASATYFAANAADPGIPWGLHLSLPSDSVELQDDAGRLVARFCYGGTGECVVEPAADQSLTRSPDVSGEWTAHTSAAGGTAGAAFSPGTKADGSPFP